MPTVSFFPASSACNEPMQMGRTTSITTKPAHRCGGRASCPPKIDVFISILQLLNIPIHFQLFWRIRWTPMSFTQSKLIENRNDYEQRPGHDELIHRRN